MGALDRMKQAAQKERVTVQTETSALERMKQAAEKEKTRSAETESSPVLWGSAQWETDKMAKGKNLLENGTLSNVAKSNASSSLSSYANLLGLAADLDSTAARSPRGIEEGRLYATPVEGQKTAQEWYDTSDRLDQAASEAQQKALDGKGELGQTIVKGLTVGGNILSHVAANAIVPGIGTLAYAAEAAGDISGNYRRTKGNTQGYLADQQIGQYGAGNINLYDRPQYTFEDGRVGTVHSITVEMDGKYYLLPTIGRDANGNAIKMTDDEAIRHARDTGEVLGVFNTQGEADQYAELLHQAQDYRYTSEYDPKKALGAAALAAGGVALGSAAAGAIGKAGIGAMTKAGVQNLIAPNVALSAGAGFGFGATNTAFNEAAKALTDDTYSFDAKAAAVNLITATAISAISGFIRATTASVANKEYMAEQARALTEEYQQIRLRMADKSVDPTARAAAAQHLYERMSEMQDWLSKAQVIGANEEVKATWALLDWMKADVGKYLAPVPYGAQTTAPAAANPFTQMTVPATQNTIPTEQIAVNPIAPAAQPTLAQAEPVEPPANNLTPEEIKPVEAQETPAKQEAVAPKQETPVKEAEAKTPWIVVETISNGEIQQRNNDIVKSYGDKQLGKNGAETLTGFYNGEDTTAYIKEMTAFYNAGKNGAEFESVAGETSLTDPQKRAAFIAGQADANLETRKTNDTPLQESPARGTITTKKSNWPAHDVEWTVPGKKKPIAYSTVATSDSIGVMADEHPDASISELVQYFNYGPDEKNVLQQYINAGYGDQNAREWFSYDARHSIRPTALYNKQGVKSWEDVIDSGRVSSMTNGELNAVKNIFEKPKTENKKEDVANGGDNAGVDKGRENIRGGDTGQRRLPAAGHKPEAEGSVQDDSSRRAAGVQPHEGSAGGAGTRSGRSNDSVRSEPRGDAGGAGQGDGQTVPGVDDGDRGSAEPGRLGGADESGGSAVSKPKTKNRKNYRITEDIDSKRPNFNDNVSAIKLLKNLMESGRKPTAEEMATLAKFKGWGGLKDILVEGSYYNRQLKSILTPEEMNAAKLSTLNAHYTSTKVISAMYDAVKRLGFNGGRVLEPSMGVGNFFGAMPDKLSRASDLYGVELDSITGNIAKLLYPDAKIDVAGFQDVLYPDDTFDLVIGNVPFSNDIKIPYRNTTYNLHDFFFVKALDETRPGGIVALITSTGTLDKISGKTQKSIADRANLIAAFRLPDDAFKTNAGTEVTTDLIFLQKKGGGIEDNGVEFQKIGEIDGIPINEYYVSRPKNILGTLSREKGMYANERTVVHGTGEDMQTVLSKAIKTLPKDIMNGGIAAAKPVTVRKRGQRSKASFTANADGSVTITDSSTGEVIEYGNATKAEKEKAQTIKDYIGLKDTFLDLLETEARGDNGSFLRDKLNTQYDDFKKNHGDLTSRDNKKLLSPDGDYIRTTGLEVKSKDGVEKSDIFRVPTISKTRKTHADTAEEALSVSLNESGRIDLDRMAELTGGTKEQLLKSLEDEIIQTPDGDYQLVAQYASGNIYQKLDQIKGKPGFDRQRKLLESALPRPKTAAEIDATFGAHWIAPEYVRDFIRELFETNATVKFSRELGKWDVQMGWSGVRRFSTDRVSAKEIVENTLNGKNIEVKDKPSDGSKVLNEAETKLAQAKQEDLREAFRNWAFKDKSRAEALIDTFNRSLNAYAPMNYDALADRIDFGVNHASRKQPRPYQKAAAARIVFGGNTLLHNGVGTGKTLTMIIAAHAMKRAGIAQKPMLVVPNGKVEDFRSEILEAYPDAKILALDNDAMTPKQIQSTKAMIATGDWDYVIVFRTAFQRLPLSPETEAQMLQRQLDIYEDAARDMAGDRNGSKRFEKGLQARIETMKNRIQKVLDKQKDDSVYFDDMGIDALFIDEAHNYKKVGFPTTFQFSGIVADTNDITTDLYMKEEYLRDRGDRIVLATATPITNAISEMYNMAMHVAPEVYRDAGIYSFDTWANTFVNIESQPEIASDGKTYRRKERARNFKNANALFALYRQFADIKQTKDYVEGLPEAEYIIVKSEGTDLHKQILSYLSNLPADKTLQMNNDGKAAASDLRLVTDLLSEMGLDMTAEELDLPGSKINKAVAAIVDEYQKSSDIRGTQFVFLDSGVNSSGTRYHYNLYDDLVKKLVKSGIPKSEIAKIGDYDGEDKRQILYDKMNNGEIRVLIGSTAKMGEGVNAQQRAVALHHLSVPYRPDNLEQREGRIVRSGNMNKNVRIYKYIQEESYDSYLWQMIERKAAYLAEAYNGGDATEVDELSDAQVSAREAKAIATGNPLIMEKMNLQDKISRLRILYRGWQGEQYDAQRNIDKFRADMIDAANKAKNAEADMKTYQAAAEKAGDKFTITIGNKTFDNRKDAAEALGKALANDRGGKVGTVYGLDFGTMYSQSLNERVFYVRGKNEYYNSIGDSPSGNLTRIANLAEKGPVSAKASAEKAEKRNDAAIRDAQQTLKTPFKQKAELEQAQARMREIDRELGITDSAEIVSEADQGNDAASDNVDEMRYTKSNYESEWNAERISGGTAEVRSLSEIVEHIRHDLGVNITTGHVRGVRGQYDRNTKGVRSKIANDLPNISHEIGHHLDNVYGLRDNLSPELVKELQDGLGEEQRSEYSKKRWTTEGIAEYFRKYLQNRETAAIDYPYFTAYWKGLVTGRDAAMIDQLADEVNAYYSLDADTATSSIRRKEQAGADFRTTGEKIHEASDRWYQHWVDSNHAIDRFAREMGDDQTYKLATNAAYSDAMAGAILTGDLYNADGKYVSPGLKTALNGINLKSKEYDLFGEYLVVKHGPERLAEGMRIFADDRKNSTAWMNRRQAELEAEYPQFKKASERLYDFRHDFYEAWGVDTGLISQETLDEWEERWDFYMPLNRAIDIYARGTGAKRGFANQTSTIKRAHGSGLDIINPVDNLIDNIVLMVNAGTRNNVMRSLTDAALKYGNALWMENVPPSAKKKTFDMTGVKAQLSNALDEINMTAASKAEMQDVIANISDILEQYGRGAAFGNVVTVLKNGKPEYWKVNDPLLLESLVKFDTGKSNKVVEGYKAISRFMTACITGDDVLWSVFSNFPRDLQTLMTYSPDKNHPLALFRELGSAYVNRFRSYENTDPIYKEYLAMGGGQTSVYTSDKNLAKRARDKFTGSKMGWLNPLEWLSFISETVESGPRYVTYKLCRLRGMTPQEAMYASHEITVNFRRGGTIGRDVNGFVLYFNAAVQGADKFNRYFTANDAPPEQRKKVAAGRIMAYIASQAILGTLMYALNNRDDESRENYQQLSNYTKNSYWLFPMGDGKYFAIPKARELSVPASLFESLAEYFHGGNKNAFDGFWSYATDNYAPPVVSDVLAVPDDGANALWGALASAGIAGVVGTTMANKDYLGRPIESAGMQYLEPGDRYNQRTSTLAKLFADGMRTVSGGSVDLSPQMLDYFFQQTLGGFWKVQKALFPVGSENRDLTLGLQGRFIKDNQYSTDLVNWLYDKADESSMASKSDPSDIGKKITAAMDSRMTSFYSTYNKLAKNSTEAERGTRQVVLNMIKEYQKNDDLGDIPGTERLVYQTVVADGQTDLLPSTMKSTVKDAKKKDHQLTDVQYVEYQADYNRLYWLYAGQELKNVKKAEDRIPKLRAAKTKAKEDATNRVLNRIGAPA